jgi:hypothetical protein
MKPLSWLDRPLLSIGWIEDTSPRELVAVLRSTVGAPSQWEAYAYAGADDPVGLGPFADRELARQAVAVLFAGAERAVA